MGAKRIFVNELKAGLGIDQPFLVAQKDLRTTRGGDFYITLSLADKTGQVAARMWQASEAVYNAIPLEGFLQVRGRVEDYKGATQVIVDACRPLAAEKIAADDFLAVTERNVETMWSELLEILRAVKDRHIRLLIKKFVEDRQFVAAFQRSPASMFLHHPFIGGLLEHTLNLARCCRELLPMYPALNADLVLAGVLFHDMGKSAELQAGTAVTYTDRGQLVGHITIAAIWLQEKARLLAEESGEPFPQATLDLLQHIVLSHHGQHEFGSPKLPMVPEAYFLHYLDNLDAKMFMTVRDITADTDPRTSFTGFSKELQTRLYKRSAQGGGGEGGPKLFE